MHTSLLSCLGRDTRCKKKVVSDLNFIVGKGVKKTAGGLEVSLFVPVPGASWVSYYGCMLGNSKVLGPIGQYCWHSYGPNILLMNFAG